MDRHPRQVRDGGYQGARPRSRGRDSTCAARSNTTRRRGRLRRGRVHCAGKGPGSFWGGFRAMISIRMRDRAAMICAVGASGQLQVPCYILARDLGYGYGDAMDLAGAAWNHIWCLAGYHDNREMWAEAESLLR